MPGYKMPPKRTYLSKFARSQRQRIAREKKLQDANPDRDTNDIKKDVVRKLCTNSSVFSITKMKNQRNGSVEVRYDEAPYIRLLHQSGLNYVDIEKILREEGRYVSRQTISLVARNLKKTLFRVLHIPKPVDIPEDARKWIDKCFAENASVSNVRDKLEELHGINASMYQLISIKKELQRSTEVAAVTNCFGSALSSELTSLNPAKDKKIAGTIKSEENSLPQTSSETLASASSVSNSTKESNSVSDIKMEVSSVVNSMNKLAEESSQSPQLQSQTKTENGNLQKTNFVPFDCTNEEEPLSIVCCPDVLPYASNVSPFPLEIHNDESENSNDSGSGLNGTPLSIVCCPDLPTENLVDMVATQGEPGYHPIVRRGRKAPPDHISILTPDGNFSTEFLSWAKKHSTWEGNFASTLSQNIFSDKERLESNCMGVRKKALDPVKLCKIRQAVFDLYNVSNENKGKTWNNCIKAIDSASRTFRCKNKGHAGNLTT